MKITVVDPGEAKAVLERASTTSGTTVPWIKAVREGKMIFVPGDAKTSFAARAGRWARGRGVRVRQHKGTRDNVVGYYVWAEPRDD